MDLLIPSSGLLFWMTIVFLIVFFILRKYGFPVIIKMVKERKEYIDSGIQKANEANKKLSDIHRAGESIMHKALVQQTSILKTAADRRDAIVKEAQGKAQEEAARIISEAKKDIAGEKQNALRDIKSQVAEISIQVAEKILQQKLSSDEKQMDLISRLLDNVAISQNNEYK